MRRLLLLGLFVTACEGREPAGAWSGHASHQNGAGPAAVEALALEIEARVDDYLLLTQRWDPAVAARVFPPSMRADAISSIAWLRAQVGPCHDAKIVGVRRGELAEFSLLCARGRSDLALALDAGGEVRRLIASTPGGAVRPAVEHAARALVGWRAARNPAPEFAEGVTRDAFVADFAAFEAQPWNCRVGARLKGSAFGGVFALHCPGHDDARLVIDLDAEDRVRRAFVDAGELRG